MTEEKTEIESLSPDELKEYFNSLPDDEQTKLLRSILWLKSIKQLFPTGVLLLLKIDRKQGLSLESVAATLDNLSFLEGLKLSPSQVPPPYMG